MILAFFLDVGGVWLCQAWASLHGRAVRVLRGASYSLRSKRPRVFGNWQSISDCEFHSSMRSFLWNFSTRACGRAICASVCAGWDFGCMIRHNFVYQIS